MVYNFIIKSRELQRSESVIHFLTAAFHKYNATTPESFKVIPYDIGLEMFKTWLLEKEAEFLKIARLETKNDVDDFLIWINDNLPDEPLLKQLKKKLDL